MRAIFIDIQRPLDSALLDPVNSQNLGGMAVSLNSKLNRPRREFKVRSWDVLLAQQIELLRNEIQAGRSTGVYWLDGDVYGYITEPMFVGDGNSVQKQFPLPVNNVFPSSCKFWNNQTLKTDWTLINEPATVIFTTAPTGRITFTGRRKFKVINKPENENLMQESQLFSNSEDGAYSSEGITLVEVEAVDIA